MHTQSASWHRWNGSVAINNEEPRAYQRPQMANFCCRNAVLSCQERKLPEWNLSHTELLAKRNCYHPIWAELHYQKHLNRKLLPSESSPEISHTLLVLMLQLWGSVQRNMGFSPLSFFSTGLQEKGSGWYPSDGEPSPNHDCDPPSPWEPTIS